MFFVEGGETPFDWRNKKWFRPLKLPPLPQNALLDIRIYIWLKNNYLT